MKIENKDDKPNTGRLHVDYANARNDQHEWECEQRALAREMRHQQQLQDECMRVPSPPPVAPFTVYDGNALLEVIKSDTGFMQGSQQLITWLDRGSVDKRSSSLFYSLIQSSNTHVRRLITEKQQYEEEVNQAKLLFKQRVQEHIFAATRKQKNWDHFTKAQRKNIDTWYKQVQLEAYVNEAEMVKVESKQNTEALERQITSLQNALKGMQQTSEKVVNVASAGRSQDSAITSSGVNLSEKEARMMGLIACFLNVHPHGATVDYLWSYLSQMMTVKPREIEDLLDRLPCLFRQDLAGCVSVEANDDCLPIMWPNLLDYSRDECKHMLRRMELDAYSSIVSVFRAQGVNCLLLQIGGYYSHSRTAFTQTANQMAKDAVEKNAQLINPALTGNRELANQASVTPSAVPSGSKPSRPSSPTSNVVVLPSGTSIHIKGMLNQDEDDDQSTRRQRRSLSIDGLGAATVSTQTQTARVVYTTASSTPGTASPVKITISKSPQGRTIVSQPGGQPPKSIHNIQVKTMPKPPPIQIKQEGGQLHN
nr:hypothetical protein BaRGS_021173 [Batillaria attramentaria]